MEKQRAIIDAIVYAPELLAPYMHYRGSNPIKFIDSAITIPPPPFISYNDPAICCLVNKIEGEELNDACATISVNPLGPKGKIGVPYVIDGQRVVKLSKVDEVYCEYRREPPTAIKNLDRNDVRTCITTTRLERLRYLASDEFTNETLIAYILNYTAAINKLPPLFVKHYEGAICRDEFSEVTYGLNIMEYCDLGTLTKFARTTATIPYTILDNERTLTVPLVSALTIRQLLTQIVVALVMLQRTIEFASGDLKADNIFIKSETLNSQYDGVRLSAPFTCKIADYGKSSCKVSRENNTALRFYNDNKLANIYLKLDGFGTDVVTIDEEEYYQINVLIPSQLYPQTRHMGIPFYKSFDYYTVLVSMLTVPAFYYMFFGTASLREIFWDPIMRAEDRDEVLMRIHQYMLEEKGQSINDAINIIRGIPLKCNALKIVFDKLKQ